MRMDAFSASAAGPLVAHWTRHDGDPDQVRHTYKNIRIDPTRTHLNYALGSTPPDAVSVKRRAREVAAMVDRKPNGKTKALAGAVVTLPRGWPPERDPREFFEAAYAVLTEQVGGAGVVVGAWVHMDETSPHMHFSWVPVATVEKTTNDKSRPLRWTARDEARNPAHRAGEVKRDRKGTVRYERVPVLGPDGRPVTETTVSLSAGWDRARLQAWHPQTEDALEQRLGFRVALTLGEEDLLDKALSDVPQDRLDAAREAAEKQIEEDTASARARQLAAELGAADAERRRDEAEQVAQLAAEQEAASQEALDRQREASAELRAQAREAIQDKAEAEKGLEAAVRARGEVLAGAAEAQAERQRLEAEVADLRDQREQALADRDAAQGLADAEEARLEWVQQAARDAEGVLHRIGAGVRALAERVASLGLTLYGLPWKVASELQRLGVDARTGERPSPAMSTATAARDSPLRSGNRAAVAPARAYSLDRDIDNARRASGQGRGDGRDWDIGGR